MNSTETRNCSFSHFKLSYPLTAVIQTEVGAVLFGFWWTTDGVLVMNPAGGTPDVEVEAETLGQLLTGVETLPQSGALSSQGGSMYVGVRQHQCDIC